VCLKSKLINKEDDVLPTVISKIPNPFKTKIRAGYYSDKYFVRSRQVLLKDGNKNRVLMQIFCKEKAVLAGMDEVLTLLQTCTYNTSKLRVKFLPEGALIRPWETVLTVEGAYSDFIHLETIYLGILARRSMIATNVREAVEAARPKPVLFFGARFDHFLNQEGDGYAALIGGAENVSTDAGARWAGARGIGTIPHGLIAAYRGNTVSACRAFDRRMPPGIRRIALVDFDNDCVRTSLEAARALGKNLWGVRLDTSETIRDRSVRKRGRSSYGVCAELVRNVRRALDREGFNGVRIIVSGGFTPLKLRDFTKRGVPFDAAGIGSFFFRKRIDFTADVVKVNGKPCAKVGRRMRPNKRLVNWRR
jgi:nicotinate phosphoribosyltransferase